MKLFMITKLLKLLAIAAIFSAFNSSNLQAADLTLSQHDIDEQDAALTALGLDLGGHHFLSERPFQTEPSFEGRPFILPAKFYPQAEASTVSADDLLSDLDILKFALQNQYINWERNEARGWNWDRWFSDWEKMLKAHRGQVMSANDAFSPVAELKQFQADNHTCPIVDDRRNRLVAGSTTEMLANVPSGPCEKLVNAAGVSYPLRPNDLSTQPFRVLIGESGSEFSSLATGYAISHPLNLGNGSYVVCAGEKISLALDYDLKGNGRLKAILQLMGRTEDQPLYRRVSPEIGYLRMPTMEGATAQGYQDLANRMPQLSDGNEKVVVIDTRHNGGGGTFYDVLSRWLTKEEIASAQSRFFLETTSKKSALWHSMEWNEGYAEGYFDKPSPAALEMINAVLQELLHPDTLAIKPKFEKISYQGNGKDYSQHRFNPKGSDRPIFLVLTDGRCGSDCDMLVGFLASFSQTIVAGQNTYGVFEFGNVGSVLLPNAKVLFRIATEANKIFNDGRSFDGYGLPPDILLSTAETNSPEYILKLAASLAKLKRLSAP